MTNVPKMSRIVAKRHGLNTSEALQLQGRTLAELTSHARHLLGRRQAVEAAIARNPGVPDYEIEGAYDGGGVLVSDTAGRELAADALRDAVRGRDRKTTGFLGAVVERTLASNEDRHAAAKARITERLNASTEGN